MKIRRIIVLLAKGWYVAVWCVSYSLFSMICGFASAREQTVTAVATQDSLKAGNKISGAETDSLPPTISMDEFEGLALTTDFEDNPQAYGPSAGLNIIYNSGDLIARPLIVLDGNTITTDANAWAGIDLTKSDYSKNELSNLLGVKARKIKSVTVLKGEAATTVFGFEGRNGVIVVQTLKGIRNAKKQAR